MSSGELEAGLVDWYGERPVEPASGARQLWASEVSGSWSLVEYRGDGRACVLRTGDGWAPAEEPGDQLLAQWSGS
ncbi:hypothetical protein [Poseidonocella sedimentorum]|nr:hypothetical protein [Poseidonocella sedimentorum]